MELKSMTNKLSRVVGKTGLVLRKNSPEILMGTGIVGVVITVVTACRATLHAEEVLDHHAEKMEKIKEAEATSEEYGEVDDELEYPVEKVRKDKLTTYVQTGVGFVRLYAPSMAIGSFSIACILVSNRILNRRYLGVLAAYNAVSASYEQYRRRVKDRYGEDVDYEMRYGVQREQIETVEVDEKGKKTKKKETVETISVMPSDCARYWTKYLKDGVLNPNWEDNPEFNLMFLKGVQAEAEYKLHSRGYLFLNEVYDMLGYEMSQLGAVVGWIDDGHGDSYVDFGLYSLNNRENRRFINGEDAHILLDFNHDGIIWDKI